MQSTLELAIQTARASAAERIERLHVRVGAMTGVVPEALQFAFEALRDGTIASEAALEIELVPARGWCRQCKSEFAVQSWFQECPVCSQPSIELRGGVELELASIQVT